MEIKELQKEIHKVALSHGWWDRSRQVPEVLCLVHSEISEALAAFGKDDKESFKEELADIVIRVLDAAEYYKIDLEKEIIKKHEYNKTRSYRHGNKKI